jgi:hypothetical protein
MTDNTQSTFRLDKKTMERLAKALEGSRAPVPIEPQLANALTENTREVRAATAPPLKLPQEGMKPHFAEQRHRTENIAALGKALTEYHTQIQKIFAAVIPPLTRKV